MSARRRSSRRPQLTRTAVLEAALALVERDGAEALTMRRLGAELGVAAMSLYHHVGSRAELLDGLSEVMLLRVGSPNADEPDRVLRRFLGGIRSVALAHPETFKLIGMRPLRTGAALEPVESALDALVAMGLREDDAVHAYRSLVSFVRGFSLGEIAGFTLEDPVALELDPEALPRIAELAPHLARRDRDAAFEFGMEALLAGLTARAAAAGDAERA